ncbi:hypothetical protein IMZ48_35560 [Candidatus Bathyarchaeota archaeon]|nr:hypothetical protein [Candidatus Bathyarchaeota archaeon]
MAASGGRKRKWKCLRGRHGHGHDGDGTDNELLRRGLGWLAGGGEGKLPQLRLVAQKK